MARALLIAVLIVAACKSPQQKASAARETASSWAATGAMLATEWGRGAVSDAYARSTARVARDEVAKAGAREQLRAWDALARAVERHDRAAAPELAKAFQPK